jgi:hypothetical protein
MIHREDNSLGMIVVFALPTPTYSPWKDMVRTAHAVGLHDLVQATHFKAIANLPLFGYDN